MSCVVVETTHRNKMVNNVTFQLYNNVAILRVLFLDTEEHWSAEINEFILYLLSKIKLFSDEFPSGVSLNENSQSNTIQSSIEQPNSFQIICALERLNKWEKIVFFNPRDDETLGKTYFNQNCIQQIIVYQSDASIPEIEIYNNEDVILLRDTIITPTIPSEQDFCKFAFSADELTVGIFGLDNTLEQTVFQSFSKRLFSPNHQKLLLEKGDFFEHGEHCLSFRLFPVKNKKVREIMGFTSVFDTIFSLDPLCYLDETLKLNAKHNNYTFIPKPKETKLLASFKYRLLMKFPVNFDDERCLLLSFTNKPDELAKLSVYSLKIRGGICNEKEKDNQIYFDKSLINCSTNCRVLFYEKQFPLWVTKSFKIQRYHDAQTMRLLHLAHFDVGDIMCEEIFANSNEFLITLEFSDENHYFLVKKIDIEKNFCISFTL